MRPRPRLCAPTARSVRRAWSTRWPTVSAKGVWGGTTERERRRIVRQRRKSA